MEVLDRYLDGRSMEDVEFFCVHGYLPEIPIPGLPYTPPLLSWKERWDLRNEYKRTAASSTADDREFFCVHGYWPTDGKNKDI